MLLSLLDGSVQVPAVRRQLRQSWGLCSRHAWLLAATEIELRGGIPLATAVLYEDLLRRAARVLGRRLASVSWRVGSLRPRGPCMACAGTPGDLDPGADRVNRRARTDVAVRTTAQHWRLRSCPSCAGGSGPTCRLHLLAGAPVTPRRLAGQLEQLAARLRRDRMTAWAHSPGAASSAWVEAVGWFAGWSYPLGVLGAGQDTDG